MGRSMVGTNEVAECLLHHTCSRGRLHQMARESTEEDFRQMSVMERRNALEPLRSILLRYPTHSYSGYDTHR